MNPMIWRTLLTGAVATATMDVLSAVAMRLRIISPLPPTLIGRWFVSIARAHPIHTDIARAAAADHELAIAIPVHYAIGLTLAALYLRAANQVGWSAGNIAIALAFGVSTSALPWLLMFPAMGYGLFGSHGPAGTRLFLSSLITHAFFGIGMWVGVRLGGIG
jgi:hypothetical protein